VREGWLTHPAVWLLISGNVARRDVRFCRDARGRAFDAGANAGDRATPEKRR